VMPITAEQPDRFAAPRAGRSHHVQPAGHDGLVSLSLCAEGDRADKRRPNDARLVRRRKDRSWSTSWSAPRLRCTPLRFTARSVPGIGRPCQRSATVVG
jgi:hypothetical protein